MVHIERQSTGLRDFDARAQGRADQDPAPGGAVDPRPCVRWGVLGTPASVIPLRRLPRGRDQGTVCRSRPRSAGSPRTRRLFRLRTRSSTSEGATAAPASQEASAHAVVFPRRPSAVCSRPTAWRPSPSSRRSSAGRSSTHSSSLARDQAVVGRRLAVVRPTRVESRRPTPPASTSGRWWHLGKTAERCDRHCRRADCSGSADGDDRRCSVRPSRGAIRAYDTTVTRSIHGAQDSYRGDRRRGDRQAALPAEPGRQPRRRPDVVGLPRIAPPFDPLNAFPWNYPSTDIAADSTAGPRRPAAPTSYPTTRRRRSTRWAWPRSSSGISPLDVAGIQGTPQTHGRQQRRRGASVERRRPVVTTTRPTRSPSAPRATTPRRTSLHQRNGSTPRVTRRR